MIVPVTKNTLIKIKAWLAFSTFILWQSSIPLMGSDEANDSVATTLTVVAIIIGNVVAVVAIIIVSVVADVVVI